MNCIELRDLTKDFPHPNGTISILKGVNLTLQKGESLSIMGPSGSGKSTLLQIIGMLDQPTRGDFFLNGEKIHLLNDSQRTTFRRKKIGFIFQFFHLLPNLTALENVILPALLDGQKRKVAIDKGKLLLEQLSLSHRMHHRINLLSGGEMQRIAIARSLINDPQIILADEPTGNLDAKNGSDILHALKDMVTRHQATMIMVTHDLNAAKVTNKMVTMKDGMLQHLSCQ